ncbi:MAG: AEC family transporter [Lachnospiraceae bacterium]|jgi:predicted permease|nr:AEC family transporter [Lachnospiraceae bacterium]
MLLAIAAAQKIISMFLLILVGAVCYRAKLLNQATKEGMAQFLMMVVIPCLIFNSFQREMVASQTAGLLIAVGLSVVTHIAGILISKALLRKGDDRAIERFSCVFSNCAFIGIPLAQGLYGTEGVFYITAYITVYNLLVWTYGVVMIDGGASFRKPDAGAKGSGGSLQEPGTSLQEPGTSFWDSLKKLANPNLAAVALGIVSYVCGIRLPEMVAEPIRFLGDMNTPMAMVVTGISLASSDILKVLRKRRIYLICALRQLLVPSAGVLLFRAAIGAGILYVDPVVQGTTILAAACPVGAIGTMFAIRYHKNDAYAAEIMGVSTLTCILTIPAVMFLFQSLG